MEILVHVFSLHVFFLPIDVVIRLTFPLPLSQCISIYALVPNILVSCFQMDTGL